MYTLEDLRNPYKDVSNFFNEHENTGLAVLAAILGSIVYWILVTIGLIIVKTLKLPMLGDLETYQVINVYVALAILFYPITFTIIYTPIALLLAIPVVLYKHVFKLG